MNSFSSECSLKGELSGEAMEEDLRSSSPGQREATRTVSPLKRFCISFGVSVQEKFRYLKGTLVGIAKKMTARNEREATEADLIASKMQVEAADEAENTKNRLKSSSSQVN